jgi:hypothetical protein
VIAPPFGTLFGAGFETGGLSSVRTAD